MKLLKLVPDHTNIDFMRWRNLAVILSTLLTVASLVFTAYRGLNLGIDFVGGQVVRAEFAQPVQIEVAGEHRQSVSGSGRRGTAAPSSGTTRRATVRKPVWATIR